MPSSIRKVTSRAWLWTCVVVACSLIESCQPDGVMEGSTQSFSSRSAQCTDSPLPFRKSIAALSRRSTHPLISGKSTPPPRFRPMSGPIFDQWDRSHSLLLQCAENVEFPGNLVKTLALPNLDCPILPFSPSNRTSARHAVRNHQLKGAAKSDSWSLLGLHCPQGPVTYFVIHIFPWLSSLRSLSCRLPSSFFIIFLS